MELNNNMKDITGDPKKAVKKLAYPIIIGMLLIMSNNLIDSVWVAGLGPGPLAAIGFVTPLFLILAGIGTGIGAGVNSLISRYVGSKNQLKANEAAVQSVVLGIIVSIIVTVIFVVILEPTLYIMGAKEVFNYAIDYGRPLFIFSMVTGLEELLMAVVAIAVNLIFEIVGGTSAVATYTIVMRLISIAIMPTIGIATSTITVVGIAYGARNFKNIKIATRYSIKLGLIFSIVTSLIFIVFSNQIAFLFSYSANSSSLAPTISYILNFVWLFIIPVAFGATASYAFQGMGKGITSFLLTMQREAILVIIFTFILGISLSLGVRGVYYGLVIGNAIGSAVGLLCIEIFISRLLKKANS